MSSQLKYIAAQEHVDDLIRAAERNLVGNGSATTMSTERPGRLLARLLSRRRHRTDRARSGLAAGRRRGVEPVLGRSNARHVRPVPGTEDRPK
jgi:hypothetical protein